MGSKVTGKVRKSRGAISPADKVLMKNARIQAAKDKKELLGLVSSGNQAVNPKFWMKVDPERADQIVAAIGKATAKAKAAKIAKLEAELNALKGVPAQP